MSRATHILATHGRLIAAALLLLFGLMALAGVREKSNTFDELAHVTAGYSYWTQGDHRLHPENGILPQRWAALPLLMQNLRFPDTNSEAWWIADVWRIGDSFLFQLGNDADWMFWTARGMIVLLGMALGAVVYAWSRRLFGPVGAMISLLAYVFCPSLLAHSALATSDLTASLAFLASLGTIWIVLHRVTPWTVLASSLAMGLLFVSKMSAVLILPIAAVLIAIRVVVGRPMLVVARGRRVIHGRWRQLAVIAAVMLVHALVVVDVIWTFYGFRYETFQQSVPGRDEMYDGNTIASLTDDNLMGRAVRLANDYQLLPKAYLHGFAFTVFKSKLRRAFLNGEHSDEGWRIFFPHCLLVKTPLATFVLLLSAAVAVAARWFGDADSPRRSPAAAQRRMLRGLYRSAPLWVFLFVYWAVAIASHLNIGHRHILPTYPIMFILCGAAGYWFSGQHRAMRLLVLAALVGLSAESLLIHPHYLAYFNPLAGGPSQGYRHLVDSSLDWGQDLPGLRRWLVEHRGPAMQGKPIYLCYFGTANPDYYDLNVRRLPGYFDWSARQAGPLEPGTYCISATMLQSVYSLVHGNWNETNESYYQFVLAEFRNLDERLKQDPEAYQRLQNDPNSTKELEHWNQVFNSYCEARLARLCAFLRLRDPDDAVGYSILIYELDARDLQMALFGSPLEWENYHRATRGSSRGGY